MRTISTNERRLQPRVEFFLVPQDREQVPVWVFKPPERADDHAGLLLDFSDRGAQILTAAERPLDRERYHLRVVEAAASPIEPFTGIARVVWTRPHSGFGLLNGLAFEGERSPAETFLQSYAPGSAGRAWLRCLLSPAA